MAREFTGLRRVVSGLKLAFQFSNNSGPQLSILVINHLKVIGGLGRRHSERRCQCRSLCCDFGIVTVNHDGIAIMHTYYLSNSAAS
jgi:hypothetical protein